MKISAQTLATIFVIALATLNAGCVNLAINRNSPAFHKMGRQVAITLIAELKVDSYDGTKVHEGTITSVDKDGLYFVGNPESGGTKPPRAMGDQSGSNEGRKTRVVFAEVRQIRPIFPTIRIGFSRDHDATRRLHFLRFRCPVLDEPEPETLAGMMIPRTERYNAYLSALLVLCPNVR